MLVVDRPRWIEANLETFRVLMDPVMAKLVAADKVPTGLGKIVGEKVGGAELGALMSFMSIEGAGPVRPVLGAAPTARPAGCCWSPPTSSRSSASSVSIRTTSGCGCACTKRRTACSSPRSPWLRDHMRSLLDEFIEATDLDSSALSSMLGDSFGEASRSLRGESEASISELFQNPRQREIVDQLTGIMSLLEGHADVVMDGVGPDVIPSVAEIRRKFNQRRKGAGGIDQMIRRLLGLDAKMRQYSDGAAFVRTVMDKVGMDRIQRGLGEAGQSADEVGDPRPGRRGSLASTAESSDPWRRTRSGGGDRPQPGAQRLWRISGRAAGSSSGCRAAPTRWRWPR